MWKIPLTSWTKREDLLHQKICSLNFNVNYWSSLLSIKQQTTEALNWVEICTSSWLYHIKPLVLLWLRQFAVVEELIKKFESKSNFLMLLLLLSLCAREVPTFNIIFLLVFGIKFEPLAKSWSCCLCSSFSWREYESAFLVFDPLCASGLKRWFPCCCGLIQWWSSADVKTLEVAPVDSSELLDDILLALPGAPTKLLKVDISNPPWAW